MNFRSHFLSYVLLPFVIFFIGASYVRFFVIQDYLVSYEGTCDPAVHDCFVGCEDEECTSEYYYSVVEKYAPNLYEQCGADITDCEAASECTPGEEQCSITYCSPEVDGDACELLTEDDVSGGDAPTDPEETAGDSPEGAESLPEEGEILEP